jgi:hypothetical protein
VHRARSWKLVRVKETLKVKGQAVTCWATESALDEQDGAQKTAEKAWYSKEVPGWLVKKETRVTVGDSVTTTLVEAIDFGRR